MQTLPTRKGGPQKEKARARKVIEERARQKVQVYTGPHPMEGRFASPTTTSRRGVKAGADGCTCAGFASIRGIPCSTTRTRRGWSPAAREAEGAVYRVLYLFAGRERDTGLVKRLQKLASKRQVTIVADEFDILRDPQHDLLQDALRQKILATLREGGYDAIIMSPPCGTWSRAPWANDHGPRPLCARGVFLGSRGPSWIKSTQAIRWWNFAYRSSP